MPQQVSETWDCGGLAVLVLEPDPDVRGLYERALRASGCTHVACGDADDRAPDVILLEPGWAAGVAAARALISKHPGARVVCASIYPRDDVAIAGLAPDAYLVKPVRLPVLAAALAGHVAA